ncbi:MAG: hypothetical protein WKG07_45655 [Hymenobacter sp.]
MLARLGEICALLLRPDDINVDADDARALLSCASIFRLGSATASGPARAARLGRLLAADLQPFPPSATPETLPPVAAFAHPAKRPQPEELEMDELSEIVEAVRRNILSEDTEMAFGHGIMSDGHDLHRHPGVAVGGIHNDSGRTRYRQGRAYHAPCTR